MTVNRPEPASIRVCRVVLLASPATPLWASAKDSFSGTIEDAERVAGRESSSASTGRAVSWNELSKADHHDLRDARIARHTDWPRGIYGHGVKPGPAKGGGPHAPGIASPVPEPQTWAMVLLGLGIVGLWARRRA